MPLPESSTPGPGDLNPLTDVLYLEEGVVKRITPKHSRTNVKELLMAADAATTVLGDALYGTKEKFTLKAQPIWIDCLLADIANELNLSTRTLVMLMIDIHNKDYCFMSLNTAGFYAWRIKTGLDELHPFIDRGIAEIKAYFETKSVPGPLPGEDMPRRQSGNG